MMDTENPHEKAMWDISRLAVISIGGQILVLVEVTAEDGTQVLHGQIITPEEAINIATGLHSAVALTQVMLAQAETMLDNGGENETN